MGPVTGRARSNGSGWTAVGEVVLDGAVLVLRCGDGDVVSWDLNDVVAVQLQGASVALSLVGPLAAPRLLAGSEFCGPSGFAQPEIRF